MKDLRYLEDSIVEPHRGRRAYPPEEGIHGHYSCIWAATNMYPILSLDLIASSIYDRCSVGPSIRLNRTRHCVTITSMIQV